MNYNYEKGAFSKINFSYNERMKLLSIEEREGEFPGMLQERTFNIIPVSENGVGKIKTVKYNGLSMKIVL